MKNNIDPYSGDRFHEPPLFLFLYKLLLKVFPENVIFLALDIWTACVLYRLARKQMEGVYKEQEVNKDKVGGDVIRKLLRGSEFLMVPFYVVLVYLFNPFTLLNCLGKSTTLFTNFFIALFLLYLKKGRTKMVIVIWLLLSCNFRKRYCSTLAVFSKCSFPLSNCAFYSFAVEICKTREIYCCHNNNSDFVAHLR